MAGKFSEAEIQRWAKMVDVTDGMTRDDVISQVREMVGTPGLAEAVADELIGAKDPLHIPEKLRRKKGEKSASPGGEKSVEDADRSEAPMSGPYEVTLDLHNPTIVEAAGKKADGKLVFESFRKAKRALLLWLRLERARIQNLRRTIRTWKSPPATDKN